MKYLSLFSGVEAATVAWKPLGWEAVAFAEISPYPCAVLEQHYPDVPNLGDVTKITDAQIQALGHIDVVIGGSPCQDLSIAGNRQGLGGDRSSLFYEQLRIFNAARTLCGARYLIWENVPGAFSSSGGGDFTCVVNALSGGDFNTPEKGWGKEGVALGVNGLLEWCVLDAQWFGLAQRRSRCFALLDTGDWSSRPPILLDREGKLGSDQPVRPQRLSSATEAEPSVVGNRLVAFGNYKDDGTASTLKARDYKDATDLVVHDMHCADLSPTVVTGAPFDRTGNSRVEADALVVIPASMFGVDSPRYAVRRLTPTECERLQGFPDGYTDIPWSGRGKTTDSHRYSAMGNSFAVNVIRWIGKRIAEVSNA